MAKIKIQMLEDHNDCETCGGGYESGGRVWINDRMVFEFVPHAGCYDNQYMTDVDLIEKALNILGHTLELTFGEEGND